MVIFSEGSWLEQHVHVALSISKLFNCSRIALENIVYKWRCGRVVRLQRSICRISRSVSNHTQKTVAAGSTVHSRVVIAL